MVDVLGIKIVKWRHKMIRISRRVGNLHVETPPNRNHLFQHAQRQPKITHVLKDMRQNDKIKLPQVLHRFSQMIQTAEANSPISTGLCNTAR